MVDTNRSYAELVALLPDNIIGRIEPQDLRDMLLSLKSSHGSFYRNVAAATTIGVAGTYVKAAGTTSAGHLDDFTMPADNRLTFVGVSPRHCIVTAALSVTVGGVNQTLGFKIAKNGIPIDASLLRRFVSVGADMGALAVIADTTLELNDYVEVWVTNETSTNAVTLVESQLHISGTLE